MAKQFTGREREVIRKSLISACKECWERYGYQKTGVRELAEIAGISSGAFYQFYESKELLFVEAAQSYEAETERLFTEVISQSPNKKGVATGIKAVTAYIAKIPWLTFLHEDWAAISRKLPEDFIANDFDKDRLRIERLLETFVLKPKRPPEFVTQVIDIILMTAAEREFLPNDSTAALDFIIDAAIDNLFE